MRVTSKNYKYWKKKHDEKCLINRTKRKNKRYDIEANNYKIINDNKTPTKTFVVPKKFSITKNPEETIKFLNYIIKQVEAVRYLFKIKNKNYIRYYYIDMKSTEIISSDALMYLLTIIGNTRGEKFLPISWKGNLPDNIDVKNYVKKSGYLKYMSTSYDNIIETDNNIQIKHGVGYTYGEDSNDIRQEIIDFTCLKLNKDKTKVNYLMTILTEMITNISDHAYQKEGLFKHEWYIFVNNEEDKITFTFMDNGVGIPTTIRKSIKEHIIEFFNAESEYKYIETAVSGVEKRSETGLIERGNGLPEIYGHYVLDNIKNLIIISNKAYFSENKKYDMKEELKGTIFYWEIKKEENKNDNKSY